MKRTLSLLVILSFLIGSIPVPAGAGDGKAPPPSPLPTTSTTFRAEEELTVKGPPPGELMLVDGVILRPLGIAALIVGAVGNLILLPFSLTSKSLPQAEQELIQKPFDYTFKRPVGEVDY